MIPSFAHDKWPPVADRILRTHHSLTFVSLDVQVFSSFSKILIKCAIGTGRANRGTTIVSSPLARVNTYKSLVPLSRILTVFPIHYHLESALTYLQFLLALLKFLPQRNRFTTKMEYPSIPLPTYSPQVEGGIQEVSAPVEEFNETQK
jgi:hypothetical protein